MIIVCWVGHWTILYHRSNLTACHGRHCRQSWTCSTRLTSSKVSDFCHPSVERPFDFVTSVYRSKQHGRLSIGSTVSCPIRLCHQCVPALILAENHYGTDVVYLYVTLLYFCWSHWALLYFCWSHWGVMLRDIWTVVTLVILRQNYFFVDHKMIQLTIHVNVNNALLKSDYSRLCCGKRCRFA